jgi:hypothetical protein
MNNFEKYYIAQAGSGLAGFHGVRYQRGHGFFGRLLSGAVFPVMRFLGKNLLKSGANIAANLADSDDFSLNNIKRTAKKEAESSIQNMMQSVASKMSGSGRSRKRKKKHIRHRKPKKTLKTIKGRVVKRKIKRKRKSPSSFLF